VLVDELEVEGVRCLEIVITPLVLGVHLQIEEVVVERQGRELEPASRRKSAASLLVVVVFAPRRRAGHDHTRSRCGQSKMLSAAAASSAS